MVVQDKNVCLTTVLPEQADTTPCRVIDFGLADYTVIHEWQKVLVAKRANQEIPDTLLVGEHPHVVTVGRKGQKAPIENLVHPEVPILPVERGGDITYHGPGQLIIYPIRYLSPHQRNLETYLRQLEAWLIRVLDRFGLTGFRRVGCTGVWVYDKAGRERKIASIGVAAKRWVTYHGVALNVSTDLGYFRQIHPCGLDGEVMITLETCLERPIALSDVKNAAVSCFREHFNRMEQVDPDLIFR